MEGSPDRKTADERKALLARQLQTLLVQGRYVESQSDFRAVLGHKAMMGMRRKREVVEVDEYGNVSIQKM
jgi:hypothetical protein